MKNFGKFVIPLLLIVFVGSIYLFYFSPVRGLGSFSDIDPESHAQKELMVQLVKEDGISFNADRSKAIFFVADRSGRKVRVSAPADLPKEFSTAELITILGHFHGEQFDAVSVDIER
ncbi:MAG: hypothetical protein K9J12_08095 [Melioribacteraceae bacterium]|nr:hypothetical protein [Melioribacteraceae bacterium]MCF8266048.1 hypothetical protein [Melioribacteraceae bacterium]MCF8412590.1 hypothetical protein [Melioribacteraceae bacterium]MCF8431161.1 hypothetical protein [Melioribacteraceae bacterium]